MMIPHVRQPYLALHKRSLQSRSKTNRLQHITPKKINSILAVAIWKMSSKIPTRVLAGITVPDTPLIDAAIAFAKDHLNEMGFNHIMRSFLFGFCLASKDPKCSSRDLEAHAISAILHDMGWDQTGRLVSKDKRFEVDGADASRDFLSREAPSWDRHRVQLVWDAVALHSMPSINRFKAVEVEFCARGISADFVGPDGTHGQLGWDEWDAIVREFPRLNLADGVTEILCNFYRQKPETTYDNLVGDVGEAHLKGYSREGHKFVCPHLLLRPAELTLFRFTDRLKIARDVLDKRTIE